MEEINNFIEKRKLESSILQKIIKGIKLNTAASKKKKKQN